MIRSGLLAGALLLAAMPSQAGITFVASLPDAKPGSFGSGIGSFTIADDQLSVFISITFSGLTGDAIGAGYFSSLDFPLVGVPFATSGNATGTFAITPGDVAGLEADGYFSVDTTFATREIGGEVPLDVVPEPASAVLALAGIIVVLLILRKSRRSLDRSLTVAAQ